MRGKHSKYSFTENLRAGLNTELLLILLAKFQMQEPEGQTAIFGKNLEAVQNTQWGTFLAIWGTKCAPFWEECVSQMQGLLTTCP